MGRKKLITDKTFKRWNSTEFKQFVRAICLAVFLFGIFLLVCFALVTGNSIEFMNIEAYFSN